MTNFITVKEALQTCDRKKLFMEVADTYWNSTEKTKRNCAQWTMDFVDECLQLEPIKSFDFPVILAENTKFYPGKGNKFLDGCYVTVTVFPPDQPLTKCSYDKALAKEAMGEFNGPPYASSKCEQFTRERKQTPPIGSAFDLCYTDEILGFMIAKSSINRCGLERVLASILYEMTFFGFTVNEAKNSVENVVADMNNAIEKIENGQQDEVLASKEDTEEFFKSIKASRKKNKDKRNCDRTPKQEKKENLFAKMNKQNKKNYEQKEFFFNLYERFLVYNLFVDDFNGEEHKEEYLSKVKNR